MRHRTNHDDAPCEHNHGSEYHVIDINLNHKHRVPDDVKHDHRPGVDQYLARPDDDDCTGDHDCGADNHIHGGNVIDEHEYNSRPHNHCTGYLDCHHFDDDRTRNEHDINTRTDHDIAGDDHINHLVASREQHDHDNPAVEHNAAFDHLLDVARNLVAGANDHRTVCDLYNATVAVLEHHHPDNTTAAVVLGADGAADKPDDLRTRIDQYVIAHAARFDNDDAYDAYNAARTALLAATPRDG